MPESLRPRTPISRRTLLLATLAPIIAACTEEPHKVIPTDVGEWKIWGTKQEDGTIDFQSGTYAFEIRKRALLVPRTYPYVVGWDYGNDYRHEVAVEFADKEELQLVGVIGHYSQKRALHQWTVPAKKPDYTVSHTVKVSWVKGDPPRFSKVTWDGKAIIG